MKVAINRQVQNKIDKDDPEQRRKWTRGWVNEDLTQAQLVGEIQKGFGFAPWLQDGYRDGNHVTHLGALAVDIDQGWTLDELKASAYTAEFGGFIYTTPRHTEEAPRFRIVFELEAELVDGDDIRKAFNGLIRRYAGDKACSAASQAFFGSTGCHVELIGNRLPREAVEVLIAEGAIKEKQAALKNRQRDERGDGAPQSMPVFRSRQPITKGMSVRLRSAQWAPFETLKYLTPCFCPFHEDTHQSAFVTRNRHKELGIRCRTCSTSFWPASSRFHKALDDRPEADPWYLWMSERYGEFDAGNSSLLVLDSQYDGSKPGSGFLNKNLELDDLMPTLEGVILVRSPKNTGKTTALEKLIGSRPKAMQKKPGEWRRRPWLATGEETDTVLVIGHRRLLIQTLADRLDLDLYTEINPNDTSKTRATEPSARYAITVDSIDHLNPERHRYHTVIIDESEQFVPHLLGGTLKKGKRRRTAILKLLYYVGTAKRVICLDADLGPQTYSMLEVAGRDDLDKMKIINNEPNALLRLPTPTSENTVYLYKSQSHLEAEMLRAVLAGEKIFVCTNSRKEAEKLERMIVNAIARNEGTDNAKDITLLVTASTNEQPAVEEFMRNSFDAIAKYRAIVSSPTLGMGFDIQYPFRPGPKDILHQLLEFSDDKPPLEVPPKVSVFGFFYADITTYFDVDQHLWRVRHPKGVKVWIDPTKLYYESDPQVLKDAAIELDAAVVHLKGWDKSTGKKIVDEDDEVLHIYSEVQARRNYAMNDIRTGFTRLRRSNRWHVQEVEADPVLQAEVKVERKVAKAEIEEEQIKGVVHATRIDRDEYQEFKRTKNSGAASMRRYEIETFYKEEVTDQLVRDDLKGLRECIRHWEWMYLTPEKVRAADEWDSDDLAPLRKNRLVFGVALVKLLTSANLAELLTLQYPEKVIVKSGLQGFVQQVKSLTKAEIETLDLKIRWNDLEAKPVAQLSNVLKLIGLNTVLIRQPRDPSDRTKKIYEYVVDRAKFDRCVEIIRRREQAHEWSDERGAIV